MDDKSRLRRRQRNRREEVRFLRKGCRAGILDGTQSSPSNTERHFRAAEIRREPASFPWEGRDSVATLPLCAFTFATILQRRTPNAERSPAERATLNSTFNG